MSHSNLRARARACRLAFALTAASPLASTLAATVDIPGPAGSVRFGAAVSALPNGNIVVLDTGGNGAAYLYSAQGDLLSTLQGSSPSDFDTARIVPLTNGNFVVATPLWDRTSLGQPIANAGAVTFVNGSSGLTATIGADVSLIGSHANDEVGKVTALSNGAYVVCSAFWDSPTTFNVGAATWGNGTQGITGEISPGNSLVGSSEGDGVCFGGVSELSQGRYVVMTPSWDNGAATPDAGAVTWAGATGRVGPVSATNSLVGAQAFDYLSQVTVLSDGDYVVYSESWSNGDKANAGVAAWVNGASGMPVGSPSSANALMGTNAGDGLGRFGVVALANGNYVVKFPKWDNGPIADAGAAILGNGSGSTVGEVTASQALAGTSSDDRIGDYVLPLANGNYVVLSPSWSNGLGVDVGAATWRSGLGDTPAVVDTTNSIHGQSTNEFANVDASQALADGNFALVTNGLQFAGAVMWKDGSTPFTGPITYATALVGTGSASNAGSGGVLPLSDGGFVVLSDRFDCTAQACGSDATNAGAVTHVPASAVVAGNISNANSAVGLNAQDEVGNGSTTTVALPNGDFVVACPTCDFFGVDRGAVSYFSADTGTSGYFASLGRTLIGDLAGDAIGSGGITGHADGSYVIRSPSYHDGKGAVTLFRAGEPIAFQIAASNSVIGTVDAQGQTLVHDYNSARGLLVVGQPMANKVSLLDNRLFVDGFENLP